MQSNCAGDARSSSAKCADYAHDFVVRSVHKADMDLSWFRDRKRELKLTDAAIAASIGRDRSIANRLLSGALQFDVKYVDGLASAFRVDRETILHRAGITAAPTRHWAGSNPQADLLPARSADAGETVPIIKLDLSLPMGPGATVDDFVEEEPLLFDLAYVRAFTRTPPHRLRLAGGAGDSMFPTLVPNDLVWVDTTQNLLLHADRIYAASINGGAAIKRLRPVAGGARVLVISDNRAVLEPYEVDANEVVIWGRVIRYARDL